jgi:hypothetical protein
MKLFLLFFISISTAYSQVKEPFYNEFGLPIDSLIHGKWELEKVEIINGFYPIDDSNRYNSNYFENHKLYFSSDTLRFYPDSIKVYYRLNKLYSFSMIETQYSKNPSLKFQEINSYKRRHKKNYQKSIEYEIITCTDDKLVMLDKQFNIDGFARPAVSYLYTYKKPTKSSAIDSLIIGKHWHLCSETHLDFLSENQIQTFEFQKVDTNNLIDCTKHEIEIEFIQSENSKEIIYSSSSRQLFVTEGVLFKGTYRLDFQNKLLYVINKDVYVYNILLVNENQLTLVLNKSLTDKLNQRLQNQSKK